MLRDRTERLLDNLTHSLVGAAIAKAGGDRLTPLATATLVVAANAPDIDVFSYVHGEYFALAFRRGVTHGWPALLVLPFVVTAGVLGWDRWVRRRRDPAARPARAAGVFSLAVIGLLTHPSLDWLNTYGMRWALPFDGGWTYGDALFIIDPWVWLALGGAVFLASDPGGWGMLGWALLCALCTTLMVVGIGGPPAVVWVACVAILGLTRARVGAPDPKGRPSAARVALLTTSVYIALMIAAGRAAQREVYAAAREAGLMTTDVLVSPLRGAPTRADVEVRTRDGFIPGSYDWLRHPRIALRTDATLLHRTAPDMDRTTVEAVLAAARTRESVRNYLVWARYPYERITPDSDGWIVRFGDVRYHSVPEAGGLAGVTVHIARSEIQ